MQCSGAAAERKQVESLYKALTEAKQKVGRKGFRQPRFFRHIREEEDQRDPQAAWLRYGGVLGRDAGRTREAEGEGEKELAVFSPLFAVRQLLILQFAESLDDFSLEAACFRFF